jgi:O-antigen ligase
VLTAPMNAVRPIPSADIATFSDVFLLLGFGLLLPQLLSRTGRPQSLHLIGSGVLFVAGALASLACPDPVSSLGYLARMLTALLALPLAFVCWAPSRRLLDALAGAYVVGQLASMAGGLAHGPVDGNRYEGLTTHPNFYGMCGALAGALCLHLLHRVRPGHRWLVVAAIAGCVASVLNSGSRAALLASVLIAVLYPLLERSPRAGYLLALSVTLLLAFANRLAAHAQSGSAVDRLLGTTSSQGSDDQRMAALTSTFHQFLGHPLLGGGFSVLTTQTHNGYLEVANAFGVFALLGYLAILWSMVRLVLGARQRNRLGHAAIGYGFIMLFNNTIWDRFAWVALCLVLAWAATGREVADEIADPDRAPDVADGAQLRPRLAVAR